MNTKAPLYSRIYAYVLDEIRSGHLRQGDRVPSENDLAEQFGVSRITSKKALEKLEQAGLIERTRGKGSFVSSDSLARKDAEVASSTVSLQGDVLHNDLQQHGLIGVILPDISDTYGTTLLHGIEEHATDLGFNSVIRFSSGRRDLEERAIRSLVDVPVRGLLMMPIHGEYYNAELLRVVLSGFPVVLVDRYLKGISASAVTTDNRAAAHDLTTYLIAKGHKHIAFLSPPVENTSTIEDRLEGFRAALVEADLAHLRQNKLTHLVSTLPRAFDTANVHNDREMLRTFILQNPEVTAFVAAEYNIALILVQVMEQMGKHYPTDYTVVCFDSPGESLGSVQFTHIQQNQTAMGHAAVDILTAHFGGITSPEHRIVQHRLIMLKT